MTATHNNVSEPKKPSWLRRIGAAFGVTLSAGAAIAAIFAGVTALHGRAASQAGPKANPLIKVTTEAVAWSDHYMVERGFVGRLEPARETAVAFERGGLVLEIMFDEGDRVETGAVVARLDKAKLEANRRELQAQREELVARRGLAKLTMSRQDKLKRKGWSPEQRFDEARFNVAELNAGIARIEASIAALDVDIRKSDVKAPFSGTVARRNIDEGGVVAAGTQIVTILESSKQQARIGVSPEAAATLESGKTYRLAANGKSIDGKLKALRADLEAGSRTVTALFSVPGASDIPLGEVTVLKLDRRVEARGVWLPLTALVEGRKGLWTVLLARGENDARVVEREAVEVLHVAGDRVFVRGAFAQGDRVVTTGTNRVTPGQRVALANLS